MEAVSVDFVPIKGLKEESTDNLISHLQTAKVQVRCSIGSDKMEHIIEKLPQKMPSGFTGEHY